MKVEVDTDKCCGAGTCVLVAPDVFDQGEDDGIVILLDPTPAPELHAAVREAASVCTATGRALSADAVVVATGVTPRRLPGQEGLAGVHVLRTLDDAAALRADLLASSRLVVVGDGVLGAEIAATARTLGLDVTLAG